MIKFLLTLLAMGIGISLGACIVSPPTHFYTLSFAPKLEDCRAAQQTVMLAYKDSRAAAVDIELVSVDVPAQVARPQIVLTYAPGEVMLKEHARWASSLQNEIHMALLQALNGGQSDAICVDSDVLSRPVLALPASSQQPVYRLSVKIQRFDSALSQSGDAPGYASMYAVWQLSWAASEGLPPFTRHQIKGSSDLTQTFTQAGYSAMVLAHQQLIARLAQDILSAIPTIIDKPGIKKEPPIDIKGAL
jgi:uncharacterized lipoprotein YmbA